MPLCSNLRISIDADINFKLCLAVCQFYDGVPYNQRIYSKISTPDTLNKTSVIRVVPNVLTEICIYVPWDSPLSEVYSITVTGLDHSVELDKQIYEPFERIGVTVNRILDKLEHQHKIKEVLDVSKIWSKYYASSAVLTKEDSTYRLELNYNMHNIHGDTNNTNKTKASYFVNIHNKIYETDLIEAATLRGYDNDRLVMYGSYVPKISTERINRITISMVGTDAAILKSYAGLALNVVRDIQQPLMQIKQTVDICRGYNLIDLPPGIRAIMDSPLVRDADYLCGSICGKSFLIETKHTVVVTETAAAEALD